MTTQSTPLPLNDSILPVEPSLFPLAWGWWATLALLVITIITAVWLTHSHKRKYAPKKTALRLLSNTHSPAEAFELLRQSVLSYYSRQTVASLTGKDWYAFLDKEIKMPLFIPNHERWEAILYSRTTPSDEERQQLVQACYQWVDTALPPKNKE
ncbi:DUF4381 domain-containing protein [Vibrio sp.]|nr:DUF4381 domain-containing protein [Vibrio sp.]